jgi:sugar diacid utilization regulator/GAF domain-containing protein
MLPREDGMILPATDAIETPGLAERSGLLAQCIRRFAVAANRGYRFLLSEAERCLSEVTGATSAIAIINVGGAWRAWDRVDEPDGEGPTLTGFSDAALADTKPMWAGTRLFLPVRAGSVAIVLERPGPEAQASQILDAVTAALDLALTSCERKQITSDNLDEIQVLQRVAMRILKSHDHEQILLLITHEAKRLLGADICGIMLREGDAVVMQRCIGNFSADTAALRMRQGQGVAGRVFATHEPCRVEDYLTSNIISQDFSDLARTEMVRSALAAPLLSQGEVIGVLEVWRRRASLFTEQDTSRLAALANLTSLAIENARLSASREAVVKELAEAHRALQDRYHAIQNSGAFQQQLIRILLDRKGPAALAREAAKHLDAEVYIFDPNLALEAAYPVRAKVPDRVRAAAKLLLQAQLSRGAEVSSKDMANGVLALQPALAGVERLGWVAIVTRGLPDETAQLALSQLSIATALHQLERRAAANARTETLETALWDLLEGSEEVRRLAISRLRDLGVMLDGPHYLLLCAVALSGSDIDAAGEVETHRRAIRESCEKVAAGFDKVKLCGMRGDMLGMICCGNTAQSAKRIAQSLASELAKRLPKLPVHVGISGAAAEIMGLPTAHREARISLEVARQRGRVAIASYEEVGIVGILMSLRDEADLRKVVLSIFGRLLRMETSNRHVLLRTLSAFFAANCSRRAAASQLRMHRKTICYRLGKIEEITGLDLSRHEDRLLADLALRIQRMIGSDIT